MNAQSLQITYIGHATVLIEMDGFRILTDPLLRNRVSLLRRISPPLDPAIYKEIDVVLISHLHIDHLDAPSLKQLNRGAEIFLPEDTSRFISDLGFNRIHEMKIDETISFGPLSIRSTFAEHRHWRYPFGPQADPMGFIVSGSYQVYFTGDTDLFPGMTKLSDRLDLAMLPVWGWGPWLSRGHLDPQRAVQALRMLQPKAAIPIHWGTMHPTGLGWFNPGFLSRPPLEFARLAAELAPAVSVRVVPPGDTVIFDGEYFHADD